MNNNLKNGILLLVWAFSLDVLGETLTAGGQVLDANDSISADGGTWSVYPPVNTTYLATGSIGNHQSGYWSGEAGAFLEPFEVGDEWIAVIARERNSGTPLHAGYYAVMNHILDNSDPVLFSTTTLRSIPTPSVETHPGYQAILSWSAASEDSVMANILGYHVHRSSDGINFTQVSSVPVTATGFIDNGFPSDTRYYALSLVYRGSPQVETSEISANSNLMLDTDGDGLMNSIDPDDDEDGLSDVDESALGTNPLNPDSDGDGDWDGDEVAYGSDPKLSSDTLDDHRPATPVLDIYPGEVLLTGLTLTATPFSDPDAGDILLEDQWQFSWNNFFTQLFFDRNRSNGEISGDGATLQVPDGLLEPGAIEFWARLRHSDDRGLWSYWSDPVMYAIPAVDPGDQNQDGRPDADEVNGYTDLDGNGQDDTFQPMKRVMDAEKNSTVGVVLVNAPAGSTLLTLAPLSIQQIPEASRPTGLVPYGLFSFSVVLPENYVLDPENPETITVGIYFEAQVPPGTQWIKYDPVTGALLDITDDVVVSGNMTAIAISDGGRGDFDGLVNGFYVDPVGPLFPDVDTDSDGVFDSQDNCVLTHNINQADSGGVNSSNPDGIGDACQCGDQNADGKVTNTDAVLIQRHLVNLPSPFNADLCDVNGDGICSNTDAVIIKRAVLGLPPGVGQGCAAAVPLP